MPSEEDLNVEHLQLLLLIFHNLSEKGRRTVLTLCTQAIAEVAAHVDSQLQAVPLNLARILLVFDYLLHQYSKAPVYLFEQVKEEFSIILIFIIMFLSMCDNYTLFVRSGTVQSSDSPCIWSQLCPGGHEERLHPTLLWF